MWAEQIQVRTLLQQTRAPTPPELAPAQVRPARVQPQQLEASSVA